MADKKNYLQSQNLHFISVGHAFGTGEIKEEHWPEETKGRKKSIDIVMGTLTHLAMVTEADQGYRMFIKVILWYISHLSLLVVNLSGNLSSVWIK